MAKRRTAARAKRAEAAKRASATLGASPQPLASETPPATPESAGVEAVQREGPKPPGTVEPARRAAEASPNEASARLAYGRALAAADFRMAAWLELTAAQKLGARVPRAELDALKLENPPGTSWAFTRRPRGVPSVTRPLRDPRFPGARMSDGTRELPLALLLGTFCTSCDADGTHVCNTCDGTGTRPGFFNADHEYPCPTRETCAQCGGTKYRLNTFRGGKGGCKHPTVESEASGPGYELVRCPTCGLPAVSCGGLFVKAFACGACGYLDCRCARR